MTISVLSEDIKRRFGHWSNVTSESSRERKYLKSDEME